MVEVSVIVPTTIPDDEDIPVLERLRDSDFRDFEAIVRRDHGASKARNEGIKRANGGKIVFLDDDSIPMDGYLDAASAALDEHAAVTGRVVQPADAPFADVDLPWYDQGDEPTSTEMVVGCNMAVRRDVLEEVGGFDERFHHGHEENDLARRIRERHDIVYRPELVVEHPFADSVPGFLRKQLRHGKADVMLWETAGWSRRTRLTQSLRLLLPRRDVVWTIGGLVRLYGRLIGIVDREFGGQ